MMSNLREIIPGTEHWPKFARNKSEQFEARFVMVEVQESPSLFFDGMAGSRMPVAVAHGEGWAEFPDEKAVSVIASLVTLRYVDNRGKITEVYPLNPNGSPLGIAGVTTPDGRFSILMPHPERGFRTVQHSWHPDWGEDGSWMRMFRNARKWVGMSAVCRSGSMAPVGLSTGEHEVRLMIRSISLKIIRNARRAFLRRIVGHDVICRCSP